MVSHRTEEMSMATDLLEEARMGVRRRDIMVESECRIQTQKTITDFKPAFSFILKSYQSFIVLLTLSSGAISVPTQHHANLYIHDADEHVITMTDIMYPSLLDCMKLTVLITCDALTLISPGIRSSSQTMLHDRA